MYLRRRSPSCLACSLRERRPRQPIRSAAAAPHPVQWRRDRPLPSKPTSASVRLEQSPPISRFGIPAMFPCPITPGTARCFPPGRRAPTRGTLPCPAAGRRARIASRPASLRPTGHRTCCGSAAAAASPYPHRRRPQPERPRPQAVSSTSTTWRVPTRTAEPRRRLRGNR